MKFCTLTGADDTTNPHDLLKLSQQYPFVEWGIIWSDKKVGTGRYPSLEWIKKFCELSTDNDGDNTMNISLHICGKAVVDFIHGTNDTLEYIAEYFPRIQLNFRRDRVDVDIVDLRALLNSYSDKTIITQHNRHNEMLVHLLDGSENHAILFDTSGGRGVSPSSGWVAPYKGVLNGYAGGLGADNVLEQLSVIRELNGNKEFYIDMEGKLRTDDKFDLVKVKEVLELVAKTM